MKKILIITGLALLFASCEKIDENQRPEPGNPNLPLTPLVDEKAEVNQEIFNVLNLDYPGLETVKQLHEEGKDKEAVGSLLEYYKSRTSVINPNVNLVNPTITPTNLNIADQALQTRFYVRNYKESEKDGIDVYYSFKDPKDAKKDTIVWNQLHVNNQEFVYQKHRHQFFMPMAEAYRVTGDDKYVESWIKIYKSWLKQYPIPAGQVHLDTSLPLDQQDTPSAWYGLQPAERLLDQMNYMWYFISSPKFTTNWLSNFLTTMAKTADVVMNNPVAIEDGNIRLRQNIAILTAGILMPEFKNAPTWFEKGSTEVNKQLDLQFNDDGVQNEMDPSYHMGVIADFISTYELAKANNYTSLFPADFSEKLIKPCLFLSDILWPDYTIDNFNDTRSANTSKRVFLRNLKRYSQLFPENVELAYRASEGQTKEPTALVKTYPTSGYYMMMNGWAPSSMKLIHKNNNNTGRKWHCQNDNGHFSIYNNGRCFTPDAGVFTYDSNADRRAHAAADNHNTLIKQGGGYIDYAHSAGVLLKAESQNKTELIVTENKHYDDMTHRRAIFMVDKKFFVLVDEAYGTLANTPVILNFGLCSELDSKGEPTGKKENITVYDEDAEHFINGAHTEFEDGNNILFKTFVDTHEGYKAENSKIGKVSNAINTRYTRKRYQVILTKEADKAARFITVIMPFKDNAEDINISAKFTDTDDSNRGTFNPKGAKVQVTIDKTEYNLEYTL